MNRAANPCFEEPYAPMCPRTGLWEQGRNPVGGKFPDSVEKKRQEQTSLFGFIVFRLKSGAEASEQVDAR